MKLKFQKLYYNHNTLCTIIERKLCLLASDRNQLTNTLHLMNINLLLIYNFLHLLSLVQPPEQSDCAQDFTDHLFCLAEPELLFLGKTRRKVVEILVMALDTRDPGWKLLPLCS